MARLPKVVRRWPRASLFLGLTGLALVVYAPALWNGFVFDDHSTLMRRQHMLTLRGFWSTLRWGYRPIRYLSFIPDYELFGANAWGFHLLNALYHGVTAFCVLTLLRRLGAGAIAAGVATLLFVIHPVHTEAVAYISGRRDLTTTFFYLLALLAYLRFTRGVGRRRFVWLAGGLGLFALAIGAKEMAATLPGIVVLHDLVLDRKSLRRHWPIYALGLLVVAAYAWRVATGPASGQRTWHGGSAAVNFMTSGGLVGHYLSLLAWPQTLLADYSFEAFPLVRSFSDPRLLGALIAVGGLLGLAWWARRRAPLVSFGVLWFFVSLTPVLHIIPFHELAAEHHLYLPSLGLFLVVGVGVEGLVGRVRGVAARRGLAVVGAAVLVALVVRTELRIPDWRDGETLWRRTVEDAPRCARARFNLGNIYANRRRFDEAEPLMREAIAIDPDYVYARCGLARMHRAQGKTKLSVREFEEALVLARRLKPSPVPPAEILMTLGRFVEAIGELEADMRLGGETRSALLRLGMCHESLGNLRSALRAYERVFATNPEDPFTLGRMARLHAALGNGTLAREYSDRARWIMGLDASDGAR